MSYTAVNRCFISIILLLPSCSLRPSWLIALELFGITVDLGDCRVPYAPRNDKVFFRPVRSAIHLYFAIMQIFSLHQSDYHQKLDFNIR